MIDFTTQRYALLALLAAALFGISAPLAKHLGGQTSPIMTAALLYLGSGAALSLVWGMQRIKRASRSQVEAPLRLADWPWLLSAVVLGGALGPVFLMWGLQRTLGAQASLLLAFEGILTTLIAAAVFREAVDRRVWLASGVMVLASAMMIGTATTWAASLGMGAVLGACLCWAMDNNLTRPISNADPVLIALVKGLGAGSLNLVLAMAAGDHLPGMRQMVMTMLLGAFSYGVSLVLFILALRHLGSARTGAHFGTAPFFGAAFALVWLDEPLTWPLSIALVMMAIATWMVLAERHDHLHRHEFLEHEHAHVHDEHHQHAHTEPPLPGSTHSHRHVHSPMTHAHAHLPDLHHRHTHTDNDAHGHTDVQT